MICLRSVQLELDKEAGLEKQLRALCEASPVSSDEDGIGISTVTICDNVIQCENVEEGGVAFDTSKKYIYIWIVHDF